ncbi:MAG: dephospho-CoA kinase [Phocaeicola sp.]|uniref:dephospho-CoA kinase n=1 Tax=Phocaeicola TaxID=909656 RepID=UPI00234E7E82|nr:dephospho-CoA kinase [Phocaeicola oris]MCE2615869.1 dephospho-CoA kinase [Phocaeicola oris]
MIKVAITGGIGSGKSYVCNKLITLGIPVYNADDEAKRLMISCERIHQDLTELIGMDVYNTDGSLNKPFLANYLFSSPEHVKQINEIVHPRVREDFMYWAKEQLEAGKVIVGLESAILFEAKFEDTVDVVVMVYAPKELRLKRAMERDHVTKEQVEARMSQQMSDEEKLGKSDYVIMNDESSPLMEQLEQLVDHLIRLKKQV